MDSKNQFKEEDQELFKMLQLMTEMGLSLKVDPSDNKTLVSSFDKTLIPFLTEIQPKIEKPEYDKKQNYRKEFWKVFITNEILVASLKEIAMEKVIMEQKVKEYEKIYNELETQIRPKRKKRRTASEIQKNFICPYKGCKKRYGSDVSLNLHIKRKHKGGNKSDRERYARDIFLALKNNKPIPETKLIIPDDFIPEIQNEYNRLAKIDFEEEFDTANLFRYNQSNFETFDDVIGSSEEDDDEEEEEEEGEDEEDYDEDSISVAKKTRKTAKKKNQRKGSSEDADDIASDENISIISGAKSEGLGKRNNKIKGLIDDHHTKKLKK